MGGKLGNLQDFCAETQLMLAYQKHNEMDVQKQFRYTFDHV